MTRELHYVVLNPSGSVTVLFIHGFMGSSEDWRPIAQALSHDYRCVLLDLPGHGYTPVRSDAAAYTMAAVSRDVMHLMDRLAPDRFFIVGYSMGGRLALYLAADYPERIEGLIMEAASPGLPTETDRAERRDYDERIAAELEIGNWDTFLEQWYDRSLFDTLREQGPRFDALLEQRRRNNARELAKVLRGMGAGAQPSLWDGLSGIAVPIVLIVGERDPKYHSIAEDMRDFLGRAAVAVMPGAGHNVHFEKPADYTRLLQGLLDDMRGAAGR